MSKLNGPFIYQLEGWRDMQRVKPFQIMIVDNHKGVRMGVRTYLESQPDIELVAEASNGGEAFTHYIKKQPDLVLIDLFLPDISGITLMHNLHMINSRVPMIMLSTSINPHLTKAVMIAGAACVVKKDVGDQALASAIREAMGEIESVSVRSRSTIERTLICGKAKLSLDCKLSEREI
jgi:NarL family two-component system response regulator LiaR